MFCIGLKKNDANRDQKNLRRFGIINKKFMSIFIEEKLMQIFQFLFLKLPNLYYNNTHRYVQYTIILKIRLPFIIKFKNKLQNVVNIYIYIKLNNNTKKNTYTLNLHH